MSYGALTVLPIRILSRPAPSYSFVTGIQRSYVSSAARGFASKTVPTSQAVTPAQQKQITDYKKPAVNPPASTLPPPLDIVERQPDQSAPTYYFSLGKSYIRFYKTALKAVWLNSREARAIRSSLPAKDSQGKPVTYLNALTTGLLSRADYQFIIRSQKDIRKLPLVGLLVAVCGEFTPLLVVFVSAIIPRAVWIPKQVHHARVKAEKRREDSFRHGTIQDKAELQRISANGDVASLTPAQILHISRSLGLHSTLWETLWDRPPQWIARIKVRRALEYLDADDLAIQRDGPVKALSDAEVERACEERGFDVLKYNNNTLRERIKLYMRLRKEKKTSVAAMLLVRPAKWEQLV